MKSNSIIFAIGLFFMAPAFADIPPEQGSKVSEKVEGVAARILADSLVEHATTLGESESFTNQCKVLINQGIVHTVKTSNSVVRVVCAEYYCMGHQATCTLTEQY